jgi:hypothetical protein
MLTITKDSHLDHALTVQHLAWLLAQCGSREGFFIETFSLPGDLPALPCALHGPEMGDEPVPESECQYVKRGDREYLSRVCNRSPRLIRKLTVIAGPHEGLDCILYTAFGGPLAAKEHGDPTIKPGKESTESAEFWSDHALSL